MRATSCLVIDIVLKLRYVDAVPFLPILLSGGPAFTDKMRWTSIDDIHHATNEIRRTLKHFFVHDMPTEALGYTPEFFE
ncbi:hypothetical protein GH714_003729 [Hevea brasiliensis]|uniref:Uncharacterized protein n=1 Tax=Hevea brasiliensis TaxID=3981 RepID=A0A6A6LII3_HEVBR|nr:hypothetical protein GH714_003729 [Hevea brasiliensis]